MEEYLEIIKDRIDYYKNDPRVMIDNDNFIFIQSIEKLLYEYQKEKRENEDLKNSDYETISLENTHLKEELEKLQDENEVLKRAFDRQNADISNYLLEMQKKDKQIEKYRKNNRRLCIEVNEIFSENEKLKMLEEDIKNKRIVYIDTPEFKENYISKNKIRYIFEVKIHNFKYLAETDWNDWLKEADRHIVELLEIILEELLREEKNETNN